MKGGPCKAMKIGIIGAENSHTAAIARTINVEKRVKGFSVDYVWGETREFAVRRAKEGRIPNIVKNQRDMLGKIDALIVDHRHGKHHLKAALPFVKEGVPTFVDKPFCYRASEGKEFLKIARSRKTPVTSFSTIPHQRSFKRFTGKMAESGDILAGCSYGPCDLNSTYGGVFFYGIHQVEMALAAFGYDVSAVRVTKNGNSSTGQLIYSSGKIVTTNLVREGCSDFGATALGTKGTCHQLMTRDASPYLNGIKIFCNMFRTREEPLTHQKILKPVQVLEAMETSVNTENREKVPK